MTKLGKITFTGASGASYLFEIYDVNASWNEIPAVYFVTKSRIETDGVTRHSHIYIGQTDNLKVRFSSHEKQSCFDSNGANCLCVKIVNDEDTRFDIETDLIQNYKTPCND